MRIALDDAGVEPDAIRSIWTSASGHRIADAAESAALGRIFGTQPDTHSPKTLLGEPMGAGGALNAALALHGWQAQPDAAGPVLVNSCSLGGTNFSVVLAPYQR